MLARARAALPAVSRATVYGTLAEFQRTGVLRAHGRAEAVRYELNVDDHQHFRCRHCERTYDFELDAVSAGGLEREGFLIEHVHVLLEGTCAACVAFADGMHAGAAAAREQAGEGERGATLAVLPSPVGLLFAAASARGGIRLAFAGAAAEAEVMPAGGPGHEILVALQAELSAYFAGSSRCVAVPIDWEALPPAGRTALEAVREAPYGKIVAYSELVAGTDRPEVSRTVGAAVGGNRIPIVIPCHRVVRGAGELVDYSGGVDRKRRLLRLEGATV